MNLQSAAPQALPLEFAFGVESKSEPTKSTMKQGLGI
jgi:hypothetical protein